MSALPSIDYAHCAAQLSVGKWPSGWEQIVSAPLVAFHSGQQTYYKEFRPSGPAERVSALISGSRASRARQNSEVLLHAHIAAPHCLAWGRLKGGREYAFSRQIPGQNVSQWLERELAAGNREQLIRRRALIRGLGSFIGSVHAAGFLHGNLRPDNIIAEYSEDGFLFGLINNERNRHSHPASGTGMLGDLVQLGLLPDSMLSSRDRMRFFCSWRQQLPELSLLEARVLAIEAAARAVRRR